MDAKQFLFSLPEKVNADALDGLNTLFHFNIDGSGQYSVSVVDGKMHVAEGLEGEPRCTVTASAETLSKVVSRDLNPMMAMMTGKLKISNPGEMLKYAKIFGLM
jgi:putative sterol carrier protein